MKKVLIGAGLAIGGAVLAKRFASGCHGFDFEKMVERMPEDAPPPRRRADARRFDQLSADTRA